MPTRRIDGCRMFERNITLFRTRMIDCKIIAKNVLNLNKRNFKNVVRRVNSINLKICCSCCELIIQNVGKSISERKSYNFKRNIFKIEPVTLQKYKRSKFFHRNNFQKIFDPRNFFNFQIPN